MIQILPGFIVGLREGLEAFLIISLILEYLNKLGKKELHRSVKNGMYTGLGISVVLGFILWFISNLLENNGSAVGKLWEAISSFVTVIFISYFIYWMIKNGKNFVTGIKDSVDSNLSSKGLFVLSAVAVAREGAEIALFAFASDDKSIYLTGNISGVLVAALVAFLIYKSLVKVDIGLIFRVTLLYLILQAANLFGYAVHEFLSALKAMGSLDGDSLILVKLYDLSGTVLDHKKGVLGIAFNVLVGWYSKPEIIQTILQFIYGGIFFIIWGKNNKDNR